MAKLGGYIGAHDGTLNIKAFFNIGTGQFSTLSDYQLGFNGAYEFMGQSGHFGLAIKLTNQNAQETGGPCAITLNGTFDNNATYQAHNGKMTITTALNDTPIDLYVKNGGTQVDNISGHDLWIGH